VSPILESIGSVKGYGWGALSESSSFDFISRAVASGGENIFSFSSIPQNYQHLQLRSVIRRNTSGSLQIYMRMNGVTTGGVYAQTYIQGSGGSSKTTSYGVQTNSIYVAEGTTTSQSFSNNFGIAIIDIFDYASNVKNKTTLHKGGFMDLGAGNLVVSSGLYNSTNPITSLDIWMAGDTVVAGSKVALYGIKG